MNNRIFCMLMIILCLSLPALAATKEAVAYKSYDGIWFMGFNFHKDMFEGDPGKLLRLAFNYAIDRKTIANKIIGDKIVPGGVIPPGMEGYDTSLQGYPYSPEKARALLSQAGYTAGDKRLKLQLLHTDGVKTRQIAKQIKKNLEAIGATISLKEISYKNSDAWNDALESGMFHLFLLGYKTGSSDTLLIGDKQTKTFHVLGCEKTPDPENQIFFGNYDEAVLSGYNPCIICKPKKEKDPDSEELLSGLFSPQGEANFGFYRNPRVEFLLEQLKVLSPALNQERLDKIKEINRLILEDAASVNLFYITRL